MKDYQCVVLATAPTTMSAAGTPRSLPRAGRAARAELERHRALIDCAAARLAVKTGKGRIGSSVIIAVA
ncbi:MAG: hypothetical protein ACKV2U_18190 [Bryobacteraceae bacterium]